ncbi:UvrD-helicase domain-containing protein [Saccharopolyspora gloriosae]|uniref:UvrD-helicase domain-containing protein n=1 Tax=Saccharopolyspora gloriosae TaxID=455344 RepID=UPI001FB7C7DC|nr:UvrD-helicase domain-containing protein [Saccharopolyspora gloriosae]
MATVVMAKEFQHNLQLDGSLKKSAWDLVRKLSADEDLGGLRLKKPKGCKDPRVRVARVTDNFRAVLFLAGSEHDVIYLVVAIQSHDAAYEYAEKLRMRINPMNGVFEVLRDELASSAATPEPVVDTKAVADDGLLLLPYSARELIQIGIAEHIAAQAVLLTDEDELQKLCEDAPSWQGSALLDLAVGGSGLDDIPKRYGVEKQRLDVEQLESPERVRESLQHAGSQMDFVVFSDDEHMRRILEGDLRDWRVFLHPDQRALAQRDGWNGSFRITGGAGTGKTVVAMHRAVYLAQRTEGEVLVTTFTRNLADDLQRQLNQLADPDTMSRIAVRGIDKLARDIAIRADAHVAHALRDIDERKYWMDALDQAGIEGEDREVLTPEFLQREYRHIVLSGEIATREDYFNVVRRGRKVRLNRVQRARVWRVVEKFDEQLKMEDKTTFSRIIAEAARAVEQGATQDTDRFQHVIVDEAQDLSPAHWRLLRGLVPVQPNDLFICEDGHQRIYGERVVLSRYNIRTQGRSRKLTMNYRTTRQVLNLAMKVLGGEKFMDLDEEIDTVENYRSLLGGPEPVIQDFRSAADEHKYVIKTITDWREDKKDPASPGDIAILARTAQNRDRFLRALHDAGIPATVVGDGQDRPGQSDAVQLATMHRAKGIEYLRVFVVGASDQELPPHYLFNGVDLEEQAEVRQRERCLFYVSCTRARDRLVVTYTGQPTEFLPIA